MTNNQAEAYVVQAMQNLKIDDHTIARVLGEMRQLFDEYTEEEICMKIWECKS